MIRVFLLFIANIALAFAAGAPLDATLARMDQAAAEFKGLSADLRNVHHPAVINDDTVDEGTILIRRLKPHDTRMLFDVKHPDPKTYAFDGRKFEMYLPKAQTVQEYDVSKYKGLVDQFLLLGFGSTSKELATAYTVSYGGLETINNEKATRIELVPKSQDLLAHLKRVDLWISDASGVPLQQKLFSSGNDYDVATYSNTKINPNIPDAALKLNLPKGVKHENPGKN